MTQEATRYLRTKAAQLRERAKGEHVSEETRNEYIGGARHLDVAADEIDAEFHINDDEDE